MRNNTEQLKSLTGGMSETTSIIQRQQRQAVSEQVRTDNLRVLQSKNISFEHRIRSAAIFTKSLEFQLLQNSMEGVYPQGPPSSPATSGESVHPQGPPSPPTATNDYSRSQSFITKRDQLLAEGIEEYLLVFRGFVTANRKNYKSFPKINPFSKNPSHLSALAMALTADQINPEQITASLRPGREFIPQSPLSLITNALLVHRQEQYLEPPPYIKKVLFYKEVAKYLLEARYNMLLATSLDKLMNLRQKDRGELFQSFLQNKWEVDLDHLSASEINRANGYMNEAIQLNQAYTSTYEQQPKLISRIFNVVKTLYISADYGKRFSKVAKKVVAIQQLTFALSFLRELLNIRRKKKNNDYYGNNKDPYGQHYSPRQKNQRRNKGKKRYKNKKRETYPGNNNGQYRPGDPPPPQNGYGYPPPNNNGRYAPPPPPQNGNGSPPPNGRYAPPPPPPQNRYSYPPPNGRYAPPPPPQNRYGYPPPNGRYAPPPPPPQNRYSYPPPNGRYAPPPPPQNRYRYGYPPPNGRYAPPPGYAYPPGRRPPQYRQRFIRVSYNRNKSNDDEYDYGGWEE